MAYSSDLRKCVLQFIEAGGKKTEACQQFSIARSTLYTWLNAEDPLVCKKPGPRGPRTLDLHALEKHVADFPDETQAERATHFGVSEFCIYYGLKTLGITRKKKHSGIRSDARRNDLPTGKNSPISSRLANAWFTPMKAGSETKVIDDTGMRRREKPSMGLSQVNALGLGHCLLHVFKGLSVLRAYFRAAVNPQISMSG